MKFKTLAAIAFSAVTIFLYSSCTKDSTVTTKTSTDEEIATQIATNLYKSFTATIASDNNFSGVPAGNSVVNGKKVNELTCGQLIDQPFDNTYTQGDTIKDVMKGSNKFVVSCDNNLPNGYTYTGEYTNTGFSPWLSSYKNTVKEHYALKITNPGLNIMTVNGTQISTYDYTTRKDGERMVQNNTYNLKGLTINGSSRPKDITGGTADYVSKGSNAGRAFNFTGTITYLGNHRATVTFNGKSRDIEIY
ncbi:hypothetical protein [Mucilaginibacter conchicola]|nr:hypothetical protein [Mucilaginibacter conchicola]